MKITALVENTSCKSNLSSEHGLSLFIQTKNHNILFDTGKGELFLENAAKLDIDIQMVDILIISHGHYDHGGGLKHFLKNNSRAKIYLHKNAFQTHLGMNPNGDFKDIGLDKKLQSNPRIVQTDGHFIIDKELELFSQNGPKELSSESNRFLFVQSNNALLADSFSHEQNLVITEDKNFILVGGCAHSGILTIMNQFVNLKSKHPSVVVSGFHMCRPGSDETENPELIKKIAHKLLTFNSTFYTCHCTGIPSYTLLKNEMGDKISYLSTGGSITI